MLSSQFSPLQFKNLKSVMKNSVLNRLLNEAHVQCLPYGCLFHGLPEPIVRGGISLQMKERA